MPSLTFLDLPRELRDMIYSYALPSKLHLMSYSDDSPASRSRILWIYFMNKQIRTEAMEALKRALPTILVRSDPNTLRTMLAGKMSWLCTRLQKLTVRLNCIRTLEGRPQIFRLTCDALRYEDQLGLACTLKRIIGLEEFVFEVMWHPNNTNSLLLPEQRTAMLRELRHVTVGHRGAWEGWQESCEIRDATRWRVRWSGVVSMKRKKKRVDSPLLDGGEDDSLI